MAQKPAKISTVAKRLKRLRESVQPPLTVRELAQLLGFDSHTSYAYYEDGYKKDHLPVDLTHKLADVLGARGVDRNSVLRLGGMAPADDEPGPVVSADGFVSLPRFDASFSMGPGALVADNPEPLGYWMVEEQWLRGLTLAIPSTLAIVRADGDSMQPTLQGGDWVLIDMTQTRLTREGIYALRVGTDVWIKRMSLNLREKTVRIISDNPTTPVQEVEEEDLQVIGKVIAILARRLP
jgi:hypothetical protein